MYKQKQIAEFIEELSGKAPTPGGGGAAALAGTVGTALGSMVASLTIGKKTYADVEEEMIGLKSRALRLQEELLALIDEDEECFKPLAKAYGMPSETEEEKALKKQVLEECSKEACRPPFTIMKKCCESLDLIEEFAAKGSKLAVSDAGCAAVLVKSAMYSAALNVFINTKSLLDREYAENLNRETEEMLSDYGARADRIYESVKSRLIS